jgi:hypothetical protein
MILEQSEAAYKVKITQQIHEGKSFLMKGHHIRSNSRQALL